MRKRYTNPAPDTFKDVLQSLSKHDKSDMFNSYPYKDKKIGGLIKFTILKMLPPRWKVYWIVSPDSISVLGGHTGVSLHEERIIVVESSTPDNALWTLLHEVWHARSKDDYYTEGRLEEELDAELYSLKVLYKSKLSPWYNDIDSLLSTFLPVSFGYGVAHFAKVAVDNNITDRIIERETPKRWLFALPYVYSAIDTGHKEWLRKVYDLGYDGMPLALIRKYTDLVNG